MPTTRHLQVVIRVRRVRPPRKLRRPTHDAARDDIEYLFGDEITSISDDGDVTFEHAPGRRFDVVVGADGLHSWVRRLVFGDEVPDRFLGGYLSVLSVPKSLARDGEMNGYFEPDRVAMIYTADHLDDARAVFILMAAEVDRWLAELDGVERARLISVLPLGFTQSLARFNDKGIRLYDTMPVPVPVPEYPPAAIR